MRGGFSKGFGAPKQWEKRGGFYDTMQYISSPVSTVCLGQSASMGSLLHAAGATGERRALPHSRIMIHQPFGGASGQATDIAIQVKEILRVRDRLNDIYARHTRQPIERIEQCMERDTFMSPEEAKEFGLLDEVIVHRPLAFAPPAKHDELLLHGSR